MLLRIVYKASYNYCPMISRATHQPLVYDTKTLLDARKLTIGRVNFRQADHNNIIDVLKEQITDDKMIFYKEKEILFIGRSNVGKSSLINHVFQNKLARVAKKAGTTRFMHFYGLKDNKGVVIDAPGYGFAQMNRRRRNMWFGCIYEYLKVSSRVCQIVMCVNGQHGLKKNDIQFLRRTHKLNINIQIVLTKIDKVKEDKLYYQMVDISEQLDKYGFQNISDKIIATSSKTWFGVQFLKCSILEALLTAPLRNIDEKEDLLLEYLKGNRVTEQDINKEPQKQLTKPYLIRQLIYNSKLTKYLK